MLPTKDSTQNSQYNGNIHHDGFKFIANTSESPRTPIGAPLIVQKSLFAKQKSRSVQKVT